MYNNIFVVQICWIWQKVRSQDDRGFQQFLDRVEYSHKSILRYEQMYGPGFVSTGGLGMPFIFSFVSLFCEGFLLSLYLAIREIFPFSFLIIDMVV